MIKYAKNKYVYNYYLFFRKSGVVRDQHKQKIKQNN